jgi:signal transduction histidine kinase
MKHAPDGGEIAIEARADRGGGLRLAVADPGPGVPDSELEAIFRPFFRSANAKDTEGHGVGLAIAQGVVALHGGAIRAMNRDGGGLRVEIVLPAGRT